MEHKVVLAWRVGAWKGGQKLPSLSSNNTHMKEGSYLYTCPNQNDTSKHQNVIYISINPLSTRMAPTHFMQVYNLNKLS